MSIESPGKRGEKAGETVKGQEEDPLAFNLCEKHDIAFTKFKEVFKAIINELHVPLAGDINPKKCKSDEAFADFCLRHYGVKIQK